MILLFLSMAIAGKPTIDLGELEVLGDLKNPLVFQVDADTFRNAQAAVVQKWSEEFELKMLELAKETKNEVLK